MKIRKLPSASRPLLISLALVLVAGTARATFNYGYGADEYVTISNGISPDGRHAITTHGEGEDGYEKFHVYLFNAVTGKKVGPLLEITDTLDTGAGAFGARWSKDSAQLTIIYRVDRHAPLKAMTYRLAHGRAIPAARRPMDGHDDALVRLWGAQCSNSEPPLRTFGTPRKDP